MAIKAVPGVDHRGLDHRKRDWFIGFALWRNNNWICMFRPTPNTRRKTTAGQVSKKLRRIERDLGWTTVDRGIGGVTFTTEGNAFLKTIQPVLEKVARWRETSQEKVLTVGGPALLINQVMARAVPEVNNERLRLLELAPTELMSAGLRGTCDAVLHLDELEWPRSWESTRIGELSWRLYGRRKHPLLDGRVNEAQLLNFPFVTPLYWTSEGIVPGPDGGPVPMDQRRQGHQTASAEAAAYIVESTDMLGFLPDLLVQSLHLMVEPISVRRWPAVNREVFLSVRASTVSNQWFKATAARLALSLQLQSAKR